MAIQNDHFVQCCYDLYAGYGEERNLVEQATPETPLQYQQGIGMMIPAFEAQLAGLSKGDKFDFELSPENAYGERREDLCLELDKAVFTKPDGQFDSENVYEGNVLPMMTADQQRVEGMVIEVNEEKVKMDFNHPMAGMHLHFEGQVIEERPATEDDMMLIQAMLHPQGGGCGGGCGCGSDGGHDEGGGCCSSGGCGGGCH